MIHRLAEVGVGVHVVRALGRGGEAQLHGRGEVFEDAPPGALVVGPAAVALVDDDEVEEVRRVLAEIGAAAVPRVAAHEGLEDGEEDAAVLRDLALLADLLRVRCAPGHLPGRRRRRCRPGRRGCCGRPGTGCAGGGSVRRLRFQRLWNSFQAI